MSKTIFEAYNDTKKQLEKNGIEDFVFEAKQIIKYVTGLSNRDILLHYTERLTKAQENNLNDIVKRRGFHYPLQYILGSWEFYGIPFCVGPGVLIPRADTETLVQTALDIIKDIKVPNVLDLCSGSGCVGIAVAKNRTSSCVTGVEKSKTALIYAEKNKEINDVYNIRFLEGDVFENVGKDTLYDLIVSNPPYVKSEEMKTLPEDVKFEPEMALTDGGDGLSFYRHIAKSYKDCLKENGVLAFEVGVSQADAVKEILSLNGYAEIGVSTDIENRQRVVFGTAKSI